MKIPDFNAAIRNLFNKLINDGFKKHPICAATFGAQSNSQFELLLNGTDLGTKPLTRMVTSLGYELHLVPIKSDNIEGLNYLNYLSKEFLENSNSQLVEYLETKPIITRNTGGGKIQTMISETANDILSDIFKD